MEDDRFQELNLFIESLWGTSALSCVACTFVTHADLSHVLLFLHNLQNKRLPSKKRRINEYTEHVLDETNVRIMPAQHVSRITVLVLKNILFHFVTSNRDLVSQPAEETWFGGPWARI